MRTVLLLLLAAAWPGIAHPAPPRDRGFYLMEDDLVYARFLALARDGTYRQITRDARGSFEVDRGQWTPDAAGGWRLHSSCGALRPRALRSGPLSVVITGPDLADALPRLVAAVRRLLAAYADAVFDAATLAEVPTVEIDAGGATFDRADLAALAARASETLASERTGDYRLVPVPRSVPPLFTLPGNVFQAEDLAEVRRVHRVRPTARPPFYFARINARKFAAEVGRTQPLHLPGEVE